MGTIWLVSDQQSQLGPNAWLVEEMYERFRANPNAVDESWRAYFTSVPEVDVAPAANAAAPTAAAGDAASLGWEP